FFGNTGEVWLDIENGRAVEHVDAAYVQVGAIAAQQLDRGQSNWIGTQRRSGRKHAVSPIVGRRRCCKFEALAAVELPYDDQMREALDVGEPGFELRQDFEYAVGVVFRAESFGNFAGVFVRTADESDGTRSKHGLRLLPELIIDTQKIPAQAKLGRGTLM